MKVIRNKLIRSGARVCLLIFAVAVAAAAQSTLAQFEKSIDEGNFAIVEKDLFNYVVANPKDANGFLLLARLRLGQNRLSEAKALSQKALALNPELLPAKLNLAAAHFRAGEIEPARIVLNKIADTELADDIVRLNVAQALAAVGDCAQALAVAEKLPVKVKNSDALAVRAGCYLATGDRKNLDSLIPAAKTLVRQNPSAVVGLAEVLSKAGLHRETADLLRGVVASPARSSKALVLLAKSEIYLKDIPSARIHLAEAEKSDPAGAEFLFVKALLENERGDSKQALELLERSLAKDPNNVQILGQLAVTAMRANYSSKAVRAAAKLLELEPENLDFLYLFGAASLQNKNLPEAEAALRKFLENRPADSKACVAYGLTLAAQPEKLLPAQEQMRRCLTNDPNNYEAAYQLGLSYRALGDTAKATEYLEETVRIRPDYAVALRDLGTVYLQAGAEAKARPVLEKAVALNPEDAETHFQMSRLYNVIGERELAKKHLDIFQKLKNPKKDGM
jgi:tetratricopeptide (TPR) repeat protein